MVKYKLDKDGIVERLKEFPEIKAIRFECSDDVYEECEGAVGVLYVSDKDVDVGEKDEEFYDVIEDILNPNGIETYLTLLVDLDEHLFYENPYNYEIRKIN